MSTNVQSEPATPPLSDTAAPVECPLNPDDPETAILITNGLFEHVLERIEIEESQEAQKSFQDEKVLEAKKSPEAQKSLESSEFMEAYENEDSMHQNWGSITSSKAYNWSIPKAWKKPPFHTGVAIPKAHMPFSDVGKSTNETGEVDTDAQSGISANLESSDGESSSEAPDSSSETSEVYPWSSSPNRVHEEVGLPPDSSPLRPSTPLRNRLQSDAELPPDSSPPRPLTPLCNRRKPDAEPTGFEEAQDLLASSSNNVKCVLPASRSSTSLSSFEDLPKRKTHSSVKRRSAAVISALNDQCSEEDSEIEMEVPLALHTQPTARKTNNYVSSSPHFAEPSPRSTAPSVLQVGRTIYPAKRIRSLDYVRKDQDESIIPCSIDPHEDASTLGTKAAASTGPLPGDFSGLPELQREPEESTTFAASETGNKRKASSGRSLGPVKRKYRHPPVRDPIILDNDVEEDPAALGRLSRREFLRDLEKGRAEENDPGTDSLEESRLIDVEHNNSQGITQQATNGTPTMTGQSKATSTIDENTALVSPESKNPVATDLYSKFRDAYPNYQGSKEHFVKLCTQIQTLSTTNQRQHKLLWDDFVMRNYLDYAEYTRQCLNPRDDLVDYVEYYDNEFDYPVYTKRVLTPLNIGTVSITSVSEPSSTPASTFTSSSLNTSNTDASSASSTARNLVKRVSKYPDLFKNFAPPLRNKE